MTVIDGIDVAIYECEECGSNELLLFRGQNDEGYKISCAKCKAEQRDLVDELGIPYLWEVKEKSNDTLHK